MPSSSVDQISHTTTSKLITFLTTSMITFRSIGILYRVHLFVKYTSDVDVQVEFRRRLHTNQWIWKCCVYESPAFTSNDARNPKQFFDSGVAGQRHGFEEDRFSETRLFVMNSLPPHISERFSTRDAELF